MQGPTGRYRLNWVKIGCYTNTCMSVSTEHSKHLQMRMFCHIDLFKPFQTFSNLFKPFQTFSNLFKPFQTFSNLFKPFQTFSNLFKPFQTFSNLQAKPSGQTFRPNLQAKPSGQTFRPNLQAKPSGQTFRPNLQAKPSGQTFRPNLQAKPSGQTFRPNLQAKPSGQTFRPNLQAKPSGQTYAKAMLGSVEVYFLSLRSPIVNPFGSFWADSEPVLMSCCNEPHQRSGPRLHWMLQEAQWGSMRLNEAQWGSMGFWGIGWPLNRSKQGRHGLKICWTWPQKGCLHNIKLWLTFKQQQRGNLRINSSLLVLHMVCILNKLYLMHFFPK